MMIGTSYQNTDDLTWSYKINTSIVITYIYMYIHKPIIKLTKKSFTAVCIDRHTSNDDDD